MQSLSTSLAARVGVALTIWVTCSGLAHGQNAPVRGWIASGRTGPGEGHVLSLTGGVTGVLDWQQEASYPELQAGLRYDRRSRTRSFYVGAATSRRPLVEFGSMSSLSHDVAAGFATSLGRRTRVQFDQGFRASPFYMVSFVPRQLQFESTDADAAPELITDYAVLRRNTESLTSAVTVTHLLARHSALTFNYGFDRTRSAGMDFRGHHVTAGFSHYLGRYAVARVGYGRRITDRERMSMPADSMSPFSHDFNLGIDYSRPLSLSRKTKLMVGTGSALVPVHGGPHQFRILGSASLQHEIGRSWRAGLTYGRNLEFVETFAEPLLSDTVALNLSGRFHRRLELTLAANVAKGAVGLVAAEPGANDYGTYNGSARLRWSATPLLTGFAEYVAYGHAFGNGVEAPPGFGRDMQRSEIRVGLTVWAPLVR